MSVDNEPNQDLRLYEMHPNEHDFLMEIQRQIEDEDVSDEVKKMHTEAYKALSRGDMDEFNRYKGLLEEATGKTSA